MLGKKALELFLSKLSSEHTTILDIGPGQGLAIPFLQKEGKKVTAIDNKKTLLPEIQVELILEDFLTTSIEKPFDAIWCCHVLEHQLSPHSFLVKIRESLREGGLLCITVPPLKHEIVGGHVSLWNAGLLLYHLILAGFNCSTPIILSEGYNISVLLSKETIQVPNLNFDGNDMLLLKPYFPSSFSFPFNGLIKNFP